MSGAVHMPDAEELKPLLVGRRIVSVHTDDDVPGYGLAPAGHILLDNGAKLTLWGNEGGCSCGAGDYSLTELNGVDNVITNVEVAERLTDTYGGRIFSIFVFAEDQRIKLAEFDGDDGSGYYGTGWYLLVEPPTGDQS